MNYLKHYALLIIKSQSRIKLDDYLEKHHIIPRHLGGTDNKSNLVKLTAREHFIAHLLLAKHFGGEFWYAVSAFKMDPNNNPRYVNSRLYEIARKKSAKYHSEKMKIFYINEPERVEKIKKEQKIIQNYEKVKKYKSEYIKKHWDDPIWKKKIITSIQKSFTKERLEKMKKASKKLWDTPDFYKKMCIIQKEVQNRPDVINKKRQKGKERMNTPEKRAKDPQSRKIICLENKKIFLTISLAADWLFENGHTKVSRGTLNMALTGKRKSAYGYHWKYAD